MRASWILAALLVPACSKAPAPTAAVVTPAPPQIVYVVATPTLHPVLGQFPAAVLTADPALQPAPRGVAVVAPPAQAMQPPVEPTTPSASSDPGSIPNMDREREAPPKTLREQMTRCLTYAASARDYGPITTRNVVRAVVLAKNSCYDVAFAGGDCWFEIRSRDKLGNVFSREVGRFQSPILALGEATTEIEIVSAFGEVLEASPWWAAGGGRRAGE